MKWKDTNGIIFKDLNIGKGFEDSGSLYIKISDDCAFDVVNDKSTLFDFSSRVTPRDCEIIFY